MAVAHRHSPTMSNRCICGLSAEEIVRREQPYIVRSDASPLRFTGTSVKHGIVGGVQLPLTYWRRVASRLAGDPR